MKCAITSSQARRVVGIARQEHHADAVGARLGQLEIEALRLGAEQPIRELNQETSTVARQRVSAHRPAMREVVQNLDALGQNPVTFPVLDIRNKADTTGIMLIARIVESWPRLHPSTTLSSRPSPQTPPRPCRVARGSPEQHRGRGPTSQEVRQRG